MPIRNCGTGSEGFEPGNDCAKGGGGGGGDSGSGNSSSKPSSGSGAKPVGSAKHAVSLPSNPKKLTIDQAGSALAAMGYSLGAGKSSPVDGKWQTTYEVTDPDGNKSRMTTDQLKDFVYESSADENDSKKAKSRSLKAGIEIRCECFRADVQGNEVTGLAIPYGADSHPLPFIETIQRGAFGKDIGARNVALLVEHEPSRVLADTRSNTLKLEETDDGVRFAARLPDTRDGQDMRVLLRDGIYQNMSFGFVADEDEWRDGKRFVTRARLFEVSLVHSPAYATTAASVRCYAQQNALVGRFLRLRLGDLKRWM